ncbi:MAG TPA: YafY family protein [Burkholderiaceae bacterium]|nr:YafY family protein [Burkholderiaceae bacterium]
MQASRLLSILMLLQSRGRMSGFALARSLEVSVRTVYRDIDSLSAAGVPVYGDRGRSGGYQLREGWRTQLTGLTTGEARALLMTGLPGPAKALGLGEAAASAHLKLLAALPAEWRGDAERVGARFHLDPVDWFRGPAPADHLRLVAEAVWGERRLRMRYESWTAVSDRVVDPLGLVLKGGAWYLVARQRREPRTFRVAAIESAKLLDETFARPPKFDLAAFWSESTRRFEEGVYRDVATLRVSQRGLERLRGFGPIVAQAAQRTAGEPDVQGWRQVTVPIESVEYAAREMLRLGAEAVVLEPAALRDALRATAQAMLASYAAPASTARSSRAAPRRARSGRRPQ